MIRTIEKLTDLLLVIGINNIAFVMLLASILFFLPEPIDAIAATIGVGGPIVEIPGLN